MKSVPKTLVLLVTLAAPYVAPVALSAFPSTYPEYGNKILFLHGKSDKLCYNGETQVCHNDGRYWKHGETYFDNKNFHDFYIGYNGTSDPRQLGAYVDGYRLSDGVFTGDGPAWNRAQTQIGAALTWGNHPTYGGAWCQNGSNNCWIACHSAGCYAIDYYMANFYPASLGVKLWAIFAGASATGGSEIADKCRDFTGSSSLTYFTAIGAAFGHDDSQSCYWAMTNALKVGTARGFNHNVNPAGIPIYHMSGYNGNILSGYIDGQDDGAVGLHSACGFNTNFSANYCHSDWKWSTCCKWGICSPCTKTVSKWAYHYYYNPSNYTNGVSTSWSSSKRSYDNTHSGGCRDKVVQIALNMLGSSY